MLRKCVHRDTHNTQTHTCIHTETHRHAYTDAHTYINTHTGRQTIPPAPARPLQRCGRAESSVWSPHPPPPPNPITHSSCQFLWCLWVRGSFWPESSLERKSLKWKCYDTMMDCFPRCAVCFLLAASSGEKSPGRLPESGSPGQRRLRRHGQWEPGARESPGQAGGRAWLRPSGPASARGPECPGVRQPPAEEHLVWPARPHLQGWPQNGCSCVPFACCPSPRPLTCLCSSAPASGSPPLSRPLLHATPACPRRFQPQEHCWLAPGHWVHWD